MQKKAVVGMILVLIALVMVMASLFLPWYRNEVSSSANNMTLSIRLDYYFDHAEATFDAPEGFGFYANSSSEELSYDSPEVKDTNFVSVFGITQILAIIAVITTLFGLICAIMVAMGKLKGSVGAVVVSLAFLMCLLAPIYIMVSLPDAFIEDGMIMTSDAPNPGFFGSESDSTSGMTNEHNWGGGLGWFFTIFAVVLNLIAMIFIATSKPAPKAFSMDAPIPLAMSAPPDDTPSFTIDPVPGPVPIPAAVPAQPKGDEFQCPQCRKIFLVALEKRPLHIRCPYCDLEGMID
jgi:ABC-type sugar transport system permease subunit